MKKLLSIISILLVAGMFYTGCFSSDDSSDSKENTAVEETTLDSTLDSTPDEPYKCDDCVTEPEGNPAFDNSHKGIYKGVITGSSGQWKIDNDNANQGDDAKLHYKFVTSDQTYEGTLTDTTPEYDSGTDVHTYDFTYLSMTFTFKVKGDGTVESITMAITGYGSIVVVGRKEKSTSLVECYEGTYTGKYTNDGTNWDDMGGVWNFTSSSSGINGYSKDNAGNTTIPMGSFDGSVTSTGFSGTRAFTCGSQPCTFTATGTKDGDTYTGTWNVKIDSNGFQVSSGSFTGKRTR